MRTQPALDLFAGNDILAYSFEYLGRVEDAEATLRLASERKLEVPEYIVHRYDLAFLKGEKAAMDREVALAAGDPEASYLIAHHEAFVSAYSGHLQQAVRLDERAADLAAHAGQPERAAQFEAGEALCEAFFGRTSEARSRASAALESSKERDAEYGAALALSGNSARAQALTNDLEKRFPEDTSVRYSYLPTLRAVMALARGEPARAVELLQPAVPYELGAPRSSMHGFFGALYPVYVRGEAYLASRKGTQAAEEFQKILDHPGIVVSDPVGALSRLGLARAYALSGDAAKAKAAYQDFLNLWKDADSDLPVLREAKSEFARLH